MIDLLGAPALAGNLAALATRGRLVLVGLLGGSNAPFDLNLMLRKRLTIVGTTLRARPLEEKIAATRRFAEQVVPWLARGLVRPVVDSVFAFEDVQAAQERMESNEVFGKVISADRECNTTAQAGESRRLNATCGNRGAVDRRTVARWRVGRPGSPGPGHRRDEPAVVGHDDQRRPGRLLEPAEDRVDLVAGLGVELAGRLVGQDEHRAP